MGNISFVRNKMLIRGSPENAISFDCDCSFECACENCADAESPDQLRVTIAGVTGTGCIIPDCDDMNSVNFGDYILDRSDGANKCLWSLGIGDLGSCNLDGSCNVEILGVDADILQVTLNGITFGTNVKWRSAALSLPLDCANWNEVCSFHTKFAIPNCDFSASTATVVAL